MAKITFDSIAGGELAERFRVALAQIGRNIMDPNYDPDASRGMTINLKFKPNESGGINVEFDIKTKLAGFRKGKSLFLIGQDAKTGRIEMSEYGNNRPQVAAYTAVERAEEKPFDPETGEILDEERQMQISAWSVTEHRREPRQSRRHPCQHWSITSKSVRMSSRRTAG